MRAGVRNTPLRPVGVIILPILKIRQYDSSCPNKNSTGTENNNENVSRLETRFFPPSGVWSLNHEWTLLPVVLDYQYSATSRRVVMSVITTSRPQHVIKQKTLIGRLYCILTIKIIYKDQFPSFGQFHCWALLHHFLPLLVYGIDEYCLSSWPFNNRIHLCVPNRQPRSREADEQQKDQ